MNIKNLLKDIAGSFRVTKLRKKHIARSSSMGEHKDPVGDVARALHPGKIKLELLQIRNSTRNAKILRFGAKQIPYFKAGQYLTLTIKIGDSLVSRPYSISSAPYETLGDHPIVEITIKKHKDKGFVSDYLFDKAKIRDVFEGEVGLGEFYLDPIRDSKNIVAIAGGSGITPFISMAKEIKHGDLDANLTILYGNVQINDIMVKEELAKCEGDKVKVVHILSGDNPTWTGEKGYISAEIISKYSPKDCTYFVCGPQAMYQYIEKELEKIRTPKLRVRYEVFGSTKKIDLIPGYPLEIKDKTFKMTVVRGINEVVINAKANEPIAVALERAGISIHTRCRSGVCGACRIKVLEGTYFVSPIGDSRRAADKDFDYVHSCSTFPTSDIKIKISI